MSRKTTKLNKLRRVLVLGLCLLCISTAVYAVSGSLKVTVEEARSGLAVNLIHVADRDGVLNDSFSGVGLRREQLTAEIYRKSSAEKLWAYAIAQGLQPLSLETDEQGVVRFSPLEEGIYLVWEDSEGLNFPPFLVSIPTVVGDLVIYDVEAEPKAEEPEPTPTPTPGVSPGPTPTPTPTPTPNIPQTGANMVPIWLLFGFGGAVTLAGLVMLFTGNKKEVDNGEED